MSSRKQSRVMPIATQVISNSNPGNVKSIPEAPESSRGSLFVNCSRYTQTAIIDLREALEAFGSTSSRKKSASYPDSDLAQTHIKRAMEVLLASGEESEEDDSSKRKKPTLGAISRNFQQSLRTMMSELNPEVSEWLSETYSPFDPYSVHEIRSGPGHKEGHGSRPSGAFDFSEESLKELGRVMEWDNFDIFHLETVSNGSPLATLACYLFRHFNLINELQLDEAKVDSFWRQIEKGYKNVPFHNSLHAANVLHELSWVLNTDTVKSQLDPLDICAALVAAGVHDHEHPGLNNDFLIQTGHELALRYNDKSVLENHHASSGLQILLCFEQNNFLSHLEDSQILRFRDIVVSMVLATDMSVHFRLQGDFTSTFVELPLQISTQAHKILLLSQILHCADLGHCGKPFRFHERWGTRVSTEFFEQGDKESELGLVVSPLNNRNTTVLEKSQIAFIQHIIKPMLQVMVPVIPELQHSLDLTLQNMTEWERRYEARQKGLL